MATYIAASVRLFADRTGTETSINISAHGDTKIDALLSLGEAMDLQAKLEDAISRALRVMTALSSDGYEVKE